MQVKQFIDALYEECVKQKIQEFEINYARSGSNKLVAFDGEISERRNSESQYVNLTVKVGKNIGSFASEELAETNIPLMIAQALENAGLVENQEENFLYDGSGKYPVVQKYKPLEQLEKLDKEKFLLEIEKRAYNADKRIKKVIDVSLVEHQYQRMARNSLGLDLSEEGKSAYAHLYLSAESDGVIKSWSEMVLFDKEEDFNPQYLVEKTVKNVLAALGGVDIKSGMKKIVFENRTFAYFLALISNIFSANDVNEKRSQMVGKLEQKVASSLVTLIDDPLIAGGYASRCFDNEGYPAQSNVIIKDGILKTYLHNLRTAHKAGVRPTGSGSGGRGVSFSNFYLEKGAFSEDELLKKTEEGIYINGLNGTHAGYNPVSGDFSFGGDGFMIENGKIGRTLNQFTVSGNIYKLLNDIVAIGNNTEFVSSGFGSPCVMIDSLVISND